MKKLIFIFVFFSVISPVNYAGEPSYDHYDDKTVFELTMNDALAGDAKAQYKICNFYYDGKGVEKSYEKAFEWCYKAAKLHYPSAQATVGFMYSMGEGIKKNSAEARNWYRKAVQLGNATAFIILAICIQQTKNTISAMRFLVWPWKEMVIEKLPKLLEM